MARRASLPAGLLGASHGHTATRRRWPWLVAASWAEGPGLPLASSRGVPWALLLLPTISLAGCCPTQVLPLSFKAPRHPTQSKPKSGHKQPRSGACGRTWPSWDSRSRLPVQLPLGSAVPTVV